MAWDHPYRKWILTFATGIIIFLINADLTIVNLALPTLAKAFDASLPRLQWVLTAYLIAAAVFFIIGGRLADMFGKKRIFLFGATLFTLSCLGAAMATQLWFLDLMRFLQGIGFAFSLSLAILLNAEAFPKHQQGLSVGISITITGVAQAIGPTLGGMILQWASWRWLFGCAVPLGILSLLLTMVYCHPDQPATPKPFWQGVLDPQVWQNKAFLVVTAIRILYMLNWAVVLLSFPLYLQNDLGLSPLHSGLMLMAMTAMIGILSPLTGYWMDRIGYRLPVLIAALLMVLSFIVLIDIHANTPLWQVGLALMLFGVASGLMIPASVRGAMHSLPVESNGIGMGLFFTMNLLFCAIGVGIATAILSHGGQVDVQHYFSLGYFQVVLWVSLFVALLALGFCPMLYHLLPRQPIKIKSNKKTYDA